MKHKDDGIVYKQYDYISREWIRPLYFEDGPTAEWIQGWDAYMHGGSDINPFEPLTGEAIDWQDGWYAAERD